MVRLHTVAAEFAHDGIAVNGASTVWKQDFARVDYAISLLRDAIVPEHDGSAEGMNYPYRVG